MKRIASFSRVAVAYSGGVDSTLLVYAACEAVGVDNVLVIHASSCLLASGTSDKAKLLVESEISDSVKFTEVKINPLLNDLFLENGYLRCYHCKNLIYGEILKEVQKEKISFLLDGTNLSDLQDDRPGYKALEELGVETPYIDAGLYKSEIRAVAATLGLSNAEQPSNSCLATRIEPGKKIAKPLLEEIEEMEQFLINEGYIGCRVRPRETLVMLEFREKDLTRIFGASQRKQIVAYFQGYGYKRVLIDLAGRQ